MPLSLWNVSGSLPDTAMKRQPAELVEWLFRAVDFPRGVVLLTGTGLVPGEDVTLREGDELAVSAPGAGELGNTVTTVGTAALRSAAGDRA